MKLTLNIVILTNLLLYQLPVKLKLLIKKLEFTIIVVILTNPLFIYQLPIKLNLLIKFTIIIVILTNPLFIISTTCKVKIINLKSSNVQ